MDSASPPYPPPAQASAAEASGASNASLRWRILRRALLARSASTSRAPGSRKLNLVYRREDSLELNDIVASNRYNIDTTGLVCCWPSEEVLAYYCINHSDMFRSKKVLELGSGYGLAGLAIAASTDADEVVISDGNPQLNRYYFQFISNWGVNQKVNSSRGRNSNLFF
uniref:Calmodulin-lysine N-methyltransferase n=1 Tax=Oryza meridionalis TaxID=40149 RepID=A0A0E0CXW1_9ORYZ